MGEITFFDDEVERYRKDSSFMFYVIVTIVAIAFIITIAGIIRDKHFQKLDAQACSLEVVVCKGE